MLRLRSRVIGGWFVALGVIGTAVVGACAEQKGALMLAVNTDMKAPKDVNAVSVTISTNGAIKHSFIGRVTPQGEILLPATLAIVEPEEVGATIRIRVMAFQDRKPRVLRDVRTTVPSGGRTALLRIPLNFVNDGSAVGSPLPANGTLPDPVPGTGGVPNGPVQSGGPSEEFDFMSEYQPPCDDIQNQTIIEGECKDNYVDPETLPDFESADLGDSTDTGTCFELARCFTGAVAIGEAGEAAGDGGTAGTAPDPGDGEPASPPDGGRPFKNLGLSAVTLDRGTCALQLNGANAARLNLALVTPDTGECVRPGECYVPIDRGPGGWQDENGRVQLPTYVCKLLSGKNLRLATSAEVCAAKEAKNPICTPKIGDPIDTPSEGGPPVSTGPVKVVPEDFAVAVAASNGMLFFAAQSRVGKMNLLQANAVGVEVPNLAVAGSARLPWRFNNTSVGGGPAVALANGTNEGFVIGGSDASATKLTFSGDAFDVTTIKSSAGQLAWAISNGGETSVASSDLQGSPTELYFPISTQISAIISGPIDESLLIGSVDGSLRACTIRPEAMCFPPVNVPGRVEAFSPKVGQNDSGYVLTTNGVYRVSGVGSGALQIAPLSTGDTAGVDEGPLHFRRGLASNGRCVFFTSQAGLSWAVDDGTSRAGTVLVPAPSTAPLLGVAIGPEQGQPAGAGALYYAVFAPRGEGGGVWRVAMPAECTAASGGGGDGSSVCNSGNCAGCCEGSTCRVFAEQNGRICGAAGAACVACPGAGQCLPLPPQGGQCAGP